MKRTILSLMLLLGLMISPAFAAAQPMSSDTAFTSEFSGDEIDIGTSGFVEFLEDQYETNEYSAGWEEYIWFAGGSSNFQMILVGGDNTAEFYTDVTLDNMQAFYDSWELVESDVSDEEAFFIANATLDGTELVVYYNFVLDAHGDTDLVIMQFGLADTFADDLQLVQNEVTVNGDPVMADVDAQEIAGLVTEDGPSTREDDDAETTPVADDMESGSDRPDGTDILLGDLIDDDATGDDENGEATAVATQDEDSASDGDWESMGLVSDTEWESPSFGTAITWDDGSWQFPLDYEFAIVLNEDPLFESVTLETVDGLGYVFINVEETGDTTPSAQIDYWNSPEYAERFEGEFSIVETSTTQNTAAIVYETVNNADESLYVVLTATFLDDGTVIYSQVSAAPDTIHEVYGQYVDGVEVNGVPLDMTYTTEDIIDLSGN